MTIIKDSNKCKESREALLLLKWKQIISRWQLNEATEDCIQTTSIPKKQMFYALHHYTLQSLYLQVSFDTTISLKYHLIVMINLRKIHCGKFEQKQNTNKHHISALYFLDNHGQQTQKAMLYLILRYWLAHTETHILTR